MIEFFFEEFVAMGLAGVVIAAWRALPLLGIVLVCDLLLRRRIAARFHCLLWALVMIRMLCPFSLPSSFSMHGAVDRMAQRFLVEGNTSSQADPGYEVFTYRDDEGNSRTVAILPNNASDQLRAEAAAYVASLSTPVVVETSQLNVVKASGPSVDWEAILAYGMLGTWFAIACAMLTRGGAAYLRFARRLRRCTALTDPAIESQVARACRAVGARRQPVLKEVEGLSVPAVFGLCRHTICLPPGTTAQLRGDELHWVLMHEIAHIKRHDSLLLTVAMFMRACHWFNPLAWLIVSRLRNHMEQAADDDAMRSEPERSLVDYGRLLLRYASQQNTTSQPATMGLLFVSSAKSLHQRIEMLDQNHRRNHWLARLVAIAAIASIAISGLTDARTVDPEQQAATDDLQQNIIAANSPDPVPDFEQPKPAEPAVEVSYDVSRVLAKLQESYSDKDSEIYLTSFFGQLAPGSARLNDGQLTVMQTARAHRFTKRMLHAWEQSGPEWQISLECHVIHADLQVARGIDWTRDGVVPDLDDRGSDPGTLVAESIEFPDDFMFDNSKNFAFESRDESVRSRPSIAAKISNFQAQLLLHRCQLDVNSSALKAPKVTLFNGQHAVLQDEVQRPFVTGIRPGAGVVKLEPIIETIAEGWRMELLAEVTEAEQIDLRCVLTQSEIEKVEMANLPFLAEDTPATNLTVEVPSVTRSTVRSSVRLARNQCLLIASPTTFKSAANDRASMARFYLITPRLIPTQNAVVESRSQTKAEALSQVTELVD